MELTPPPPLVIKHHQRRDPPPPSFDDVICGRTHNCRAPSTKKKRPQKLTPTPLYIAAVTYMLSSVNFNQLILPFLKESIN
jgi:hypothetical protein